MTRLAYTVNECAELSGYSIDFIYKQVSIGKLRKLPGKGRSIRIAKADFEAWLYGETPSQKPETPETPDPMRVSPRARAIVDALTPTVA